MSIKTYSKVIKLPTFMERFEYLKLDGRVGDLTFGGKRYLNQLLYQTGMWDSVRNKAIIRDNGCDLAVPDREIMVRVTVHHINPITIEDVLQNNPIVWDLENLITTAEITHKAIHYGNETLLIKEPVIRREYDTCPWRH